MSRRTSHLVRCSAVAILNLLIFFWTGSSGFSFCIESYKLWSWPWLRLWLSVDNPVDELFKMPDSQGSQLLNGSSTGAVTWSPYTGLLCMAWASQREYFKGKWFKRPMPKLTCFLWHSLGRPSMSCHFQHIWLVKQIIKTSPDSRVSALNSTWSWGVARSHFRRAHGMRHRCVHL